jgi:hypothetical protein
MSLSFGECESQMGATERVFFRHLWAQAALQGISVMVSSGDSGPAGCNSGNDDTGSGPAVSGLASTPFNVAVGGTEFNEGPGTYWRAKPGPDQSSSKGYIPEKAWNESASAGGSGLWATGGGQSSYFPRPCWQVAKGVPCAAPYRCLPDVSLAAAGGHDGYVVETSGMRAVVGGTSCSSPAFAGIMALVVQKTGERQGNPCPTLYTLGNAQYKGTGPQVFHDITEGDSSVPGTKGYPCTLGYDLATGLGTVDAQALVGAWSGGTGNNVQANIRQPAADQALASGTQAAFQGTGQDSNPNAALTYAWNFGDGGSAQGAQAAHTYRNAGPNAATFLVTFTATDETGAQDTDTRNVVVLPPTAPGELILNGGFEAGTLGWTARNVSVGDNRPDGPAHSGKGSAWFSGWQNSLPEVLLQTVRIPAQAASARLSFWLRVQAYGDNPVSVDSFRVKAREADGRLAVLGAWSNLDDAPDYAQRTIDLGAYRGHTVQLSFVAEHNNDGVNTSFLLDDVSLIAQ